MQPADVEAGKQLFEDKCSGCHGYEGRGGRGPTLRRGQLKHGQTDFAIYRNIRDGVPGTVMVGQDLTPVQRLQIVGYLRSKMDSDTLTSQSQQAEWRKRPELKVAIECSKDLIFAFFRSRIV